MCTLCYICAFIFYTMKYTLQSKSSDLVSVSPPWLFRKIVAHVVSDEAAVGPISIIEAEGPSVLGVTWILDADGGRHHGDNTATACILLSLRRIQTNR